MRHERPQIPPPSNDPKDLLMGRIIDQLYWLQNRVRKLEWLSLLAFGLIFLTTLDDLFRLVAYFTK